MRPSSVMSFTHPVQSISQLKPVINKSATQSRQISDAERRAYKYKTILERDVRKAVARWDAEIAIYQHL
jgi:hypothetical protein